MCLLKILKKRNKNRHFKFKRRVMLTLELEGMHCLWNKHATISTVVVVKAGPSGFTVHVVWPQ